VRKTSDIGTHNTWEMAPQLKSHKEEGVHALLFQRRPHTGTTSGPDRVHLRVDNVCAQTPSATTTCTLNNTNVCTASRCPTTPHHTTPHHTTPHHTRSKQRRLVPHHRGWGSAHLCCFARQPHGREKLAQGVLVLLHSCSAVTHTRARTSTRSSRRCKRVGAARWWHGACGTGGERIGGGVGAERIEP